MGKTIAMALGLLAFLTLQAAPVELTPDSHVPLRHPSVQSYCVEIDCTKKPGRN